VLPSRQDNLPNTGGLLDIVADGVTGALAEPFAPASLAAPCLGCCGPGARRTALGSGAGGGVVCGGVRAGAGAGPPELLWNALATLKAQQAWDDDAHHQPSHNPHRSARKP